MPDDADAKSYVKLTVAPDPGLELTLDAMEAEEDFGRPFLITLDISSKTAKADLNALLGSSVTVSLSQEDGTQRHFNGILARFSYAGLSGGAYRYRMELRPWIWLLSQVQDCKIYQNLAVWDIITGVFRDAGFTDFADRRQNQAGSTVLVFCVQYRESSLDFVTRLMEEYGLYYFVEHSDGQHVIALADDPNSHASAGDAIPFVLDQTEWRTVEDHIWDWSGDARIRPGAYSLRDYNFTTPAADLTSKSTIAGDYPHGSSEVYDYPGDYDTTGVGQTLVSIRMQERVAFGQTYGGTSNCRRLATGRKFTLSDFPEAALNIEYTVIRSHCSISVAEALSTTAGELIDTFRCVLQAVAGTVSFRLPRTTPRPSITGPQTAKVVGQSGQEITTDPYGRIKVKFPWDRIGVEDENASCWIRVSQAWAGTGWGAMFIPRIGQEVIVEFLEGNPDRPIITGQVYNADVIVPYALPDNATRSTIKSNSSKGGGGFNELRFEDKKGDEEVFLQAQKDLNVVVLNSETVKITQNTTTTVDKGDRSVTVSAGKDSLTVTQGNREATVSAGEDTLTVTQGDHTITVTAGNSTVSAGTSITLKVGANSIKIDKVGITISAAKITVTANGLLEASGATTKVAGTDSLMLDGGASTVLKGALVAIN